MGLSLFIVPPCGLVPAVTWTPPAPGEALAPAPIIAEEIDVATGDLASLTTGLAPEDAWVVTQLRCIRGSGAAVEDQGHELGKVELNSDDAAQLLAYEIDRLLRPAVDRGAIEVLSRSVLAGESAPAFDMASIQLEWRNLRTTRRLSLQDGTLSIGAEGA